MHAEAPSARLLERFARREAETRRRVEGAIRHYERLPSVRLARIFDEGVAQAQCCVRKALGCFGGGR